MSNFTISPVLLGVLFALGILAIAVYVWHKVRQQSREVTEEEERIIKALKARPPAEGIVVNTESSNNDQRDRSGRIMILAFGTFAASVVARQLTMLDQNGQDGAIGSILLSEMDARCRRRALDSIPSIYQDRIIALSYQAVSGGMGGRSDEEVEACAERWGPPMVEAVDEICYRHRLFNGKNEDAAVVLVYLSLGGQAITGTLAVEKIATGMPMAQFYGFTALPVDIRLRARVPRILRKYYDRGVRGFVMGDNLNDPVRNDFAMVGVVTALLVATEHSDEAEELNNAFNLLFPEGSGGLARLGISARSIPGYPIEPSHPSLPRRYYVQKGSVVSTIYTCLDEMTRPTYDSLGGIGLDGLAPGTSRFEMVLAAVEPDGLKEDEDTIAVGKVIIGEEKASMHRIFASIVTHIDPDKPQCSIATISLRSVKNPEQTLAKLIPTPSGSELTLAILDAGTTLGVAKQKEEYEYAPGD